MAMIAVTSDWHLGNGSLADDSNPAGVRLIIEHALDAGVSSVVADGDMLEGSQFSLESILRTHRDLLEWIDQECYRENVPIYIVPGNHDGDVMDLDIALRSIMPEADIRWPWPSTDIDGCGWRVIHGHQFDAWNSGLLAPIGRAVTWAVGWPERLTRRFDENWLNPIAWISAARRSKGQKEALHLKAAQWAKENGHTHLCIGHTHHADIFHADGVTVVNPGCVTGKQASYALLDGAHAVIHNLMEQQT